MDRRECEKQLADLIEQAWRLFREYSPEGWHLDMFAGEDGCCAIGYDPGREIIIDAYKSPDGCYRLSGRAGEAGV